MHYFNTLEDILLTSKPQEKFEKFERFYDAFLKNETVFEDNYEAVELKEPSYAPFSKIVLPKQLKMRKHFDTMEGKGTLLHTIAHIEYSAIDLALDAALRFQGLPWQYYKDWLEVAEDEIRHFNMIETLMKETGYEYGDFEVHTNLFEAMQGTQTLIKRMAVVPRFLEANGLDQNPKIMKKLESNNDAMNRKILDALNVILEEEITHVTKGDTWFKYACDQENVPYEQTYLEIIEDFYPGSTNKRGDLNLEARKLAGFSCDELKRLSHHHEC